MRREDFNNSLNYIDYDIVEEYVREKEIRRKKAISRSRLLKYSRAAACLAILIGVTVAILPIILGGDKMSAEPSNPNTEEIPHYTTTTPIVPEGDLQEPSDDHIGTEDSTSDIPLAYEYCYTFTYNGSEYICGFGSSGETLREALENNTVYEHLKGEFLGEVDATDKNGKVGRYKLYLADSSQLIIEIEGYFMIAERK